MCVWSFSALDCWPVGSVDTRPSGDWFVVCMQEYPILWLLFVLEIFTAIVRLSFTIKCRFRQKFGQNASAASWLASTISRDLSIRHHLLGRSLSEYQQLQKSQIKQTIMAFIMNNFTVNQRHKNTPKSKLTLKQCHELIIVSGPVRNVSVHAGQLDCRFLSPTSTACEPPIISQLLLAVVECRSNVNVGRVS